MSFDNIEWQAACLANEFLKLEKGLGFAMIPISVEKAIVREGFKKFRATITKGLKL